MFKTFDRISNQPEFTDMTETPKVLARVHFDVEPISRKGCPMQCIGECSCRPEPCKNQCFCVSYCPKHGK